MNHTPTPWRMGPALHEGYHAAVMALSHTLIANFGDGSVGKAEHEANAEFIVRACNSHDAMVEALEAMYLQMSHFESAWEEAGVVDLYGDAMAKAIAALGQAKRGKP